MDGIETHFAEGVDCDISMDCFVTFIQCEIYNIICKHCESQLTIAFVSSSKDRFDLGGVVDHPKRPLWPWHLCLGGLPRGCCLW